MKKCILYTVLLLTLSMYVSVMSEGVQVTVTTKTYNGEFAPKNAVAIWVVDVETGEYLSTVYMSTEAKTYEGDELKTYTQHSGGENDYNPVASLRPDHTTQISAVWDCITFYDQLVWDGDFEVWVEFSEESTFDPAGAYSGKIIVDTITIDRAAGYATVTAPNTDYFTDLTITYDPGISIKAPLISKASNAGLRYHFNPVSYCLSITCEDATKTASLLRILSLKGQVIDRITFVSNKLQWNMHSTDGHKVPAGFYLLEVVSNTGDRIGSVYPFTFTR